MNSRKHLAMLPFSVLLAACGSSSGASKANFADAINADLATRCIRVDFDMNSSARSHRFPVSVELEQKTSWQSEAEADASNRKNLAQYDALVAAGLLNRDAGTVKAQYGKYQVPAKIYSLTSEGKKSLLKENYTSFCAGTYEVVDVVSFTAPGQSLDGRTTSSARYTFKPKDVPAWARSEAVQAAFRGLAKDISDNQEGKASLTLENDGWSSRRSSFF